MCMFLYFRLSPKEVIVWCHVNIIAHLGRRFDGWLWVNSGMVIRKGKTEEIRRDNPTTSATRNVTESHRDLTRSNFLVTTRLTHCVTARTIQFYTEIFLILCIYGADKIVTSLNGKIFWRMKLQNIQLMKIWMNNKGLVTIFSLGDEQLGF
jgi:hypothetical protein